MKHDIPAWFVQNELYNGAETGKAKYWLGTEDDGLGCLDTTGQSLPLPYLTRKPVPPRMLIVIEAVRNSDKYHVVLSDAIPLMLVHIPKGAFTSREDYREASQKGLLIERNIHTEGEYMSEGIAVIFRVIGGKRGSTASVKITSVYVAPTAAELVAANLLLPITKWVASADLNNLRQMRKDLNARLELDKLSKEL